MPLKIIKPIHPPASREDYTLKQIAKVFPGGDWVDAPPSAAPEPEPQPKGVLDTPDPGSTKSGNVTVIGDTKDTAVLLAHVEKIAPTEIILGRLPSGRGAESSLAKAFRAAGFAVREVNADVERFGPKATEVHVEQVLSTDIDSPLIIVGGGVRSKQAASWVNRAKWPREVTRL